MAKGIFRGLVEEEDKAGYWRRQIRAWRRCGGTQVDFCRRHGLSKHKFIYWKSKLAEAGEESLALVEIPQAVVCAADSGPWPEPGRSAVIAIGRYRVEVPPRYPRSGLSTILDELESRQ